ncbi:glycosyltransferase [Plastoroseomonas arctica]|uniref:Glycosyltransferase family 4 protein n=1 Tax=Plastoroseomonas arctica TaxID=1509237 RepID=A0AAF1KUY1_9PROT|nr:glycosyltransferase [Plastoroseomonas arctica]MBR0657402.1 glycosyltransferase family 4 protein [Plastoroseomonas arctica]
MKVAIIHEWLESYAGSERVLEQLIAAWPEADLFAVCDFLPEAQRHFLGGRPVRTSFIQRLPFAKKRFRWYLGLMPMAVEQFDLAGYDLVISSHHAVAKGVITGPDQAHVSYVHSPMRYAWDMQAQYLRQAGMERGLRGAYTRWLLHRLRLWDRSSAAGVDTIVANSRYIADRIRKVWRREAQVVHPPVDLAGFPFQAEKGGDFVVVSRFVPYKRVDLVVQAFRGMPQHRLLVVGDGPEAASVRAAAGDAPNISVLGALPQAELVALMQKARAFVFAAEEDFGIAMVEAQACGTPVIAFGRGGARDIVRTPDMARPTGMLFAEQSAASIQAAVGAFTALSPGIAPEDCRLNAQRFDRRHFRDAMLAVAEAAMARQEQPAAAPQRWATPSVTETAEAA